ncbi:MAG: class I SAM-dependent methyltransferase [Alphaproteobacteria bacterium]
MTPLARRLARRIARDGAMPVDVFMAEALGHPRHGYYATRDPLGAAGDFTTAPEISQMFGELVGLWCADLWLRMGRPDPFVLLELGPGRGTLMADVLRALAVVPGCRAAARPHLVETSPALRARQRRTLRGAGATWHATLAGVPEGPTLAIANEFFDALPVRQFVRLADGWHERVVVTEGDGLAFATAVRRPQPYELPPAAAGLAAEGATVEDCPAGRTLAAALARRLVREGGAALAIDYGYDGPAVGDTLQAVRAHRFVPVLDEPGEADITAHVDFTALAMAARGAGATVAGPVAQGAFLRRLGIEARAARLKAAATPAQRAAIDAAMARLIDATGMGSLFRVLALAAPGLDISAGFAA